MDDAAASLLPLYLGLGSTFCIGSIVVLYNLVVLVGQIRAKYDEPISGLAKAAWAISAISLLLGPCLVIGAVIGWILSGIEKGRIYRGESTLASLKSASMATVNSIVGIVIFLLLGVAALISFL
jgi:hypothetical protein